MSSAQKKQLFRIGSTLICFAAGWVFSPPASYIIFVIAWLIAGYDVVWNAVRELLHGELLDENFLMSIASIGAFVLQDFAEAAAVMLFFQIGEWFQDYAVNRSRKSIAALMDLRPDFATILVNGAETVTDPERVVPGDLLLVRPGERIPVDGNIVEGSAFLDTAAITGEAKPREVFAGSAVLSGCLNLSGVLTIRAESTYEHSTVAQILELVESASEKKAKTEQLITKFARVYTPIVVASALLLATIAPLFFAQPFAVWFERALIFLVISCPCALVISVPLSFFGGMGAASKRGIIIKGGGVLETLASVKQVAFDKTGTLTSGVFQVSRVFTQDIAEAELLRLTACAEQHSAHPAARAICEYVHVDCKADEISELPGLGIAAKVGDRQIHAGNCRLMAQIGVIPTHAQTETCVYTAIDGRYAGMIALKDTIKSEAESVLTTLRAQGIEKIVMLTGDTQEAASQTAERLDLDACFASLLPQDKVQLVESMLCAEKKTAFIGDGVNDAPVLRLADVGIAMGGIGADAAVEAADVVILRDDLTALPEAIRIGKATRSIAIQNIIFALGVKAAVLLLGAVGFAGMWIAVFADVGVAILAILNAMRTLRQ